MGDKPISAPNNAISGLVVLPTRSRISAIWMEGLASIAATAAATPGGVPLPDDLDVVGRRSLASIRDSY